MDIKLNRANTRLINDLSKDYGIKDAAKFNSSKTTKESTDKYEAFGPELLSALAIKSDEHVLDLSSPRYNGHAWWDSSLEKMLPNLPDQSVASSKREFEGLCNRLRQIAVDVPFLQSSLYDGVDGI